MDDLAKLKEAAEAATPGPWFDSDGVIWFDSREQVCCGRGYSECCGEPDIIGGQEQLAESNPTDAAFIALANPATILALLSAHASALARVAVLEGALREAREDILSFVHARWSEAEGSDEDHVGYIDAALRTEGEGQ